MHLRVIGVLAGTALGCSLLVPAIIAQPAGPNTTLTAVPGIRVGHHTLSERLTGCTVVLPDGGAVRFGGGFVRRFSGAAGKRSGDQQVFQKPSHVLSPCSSPWSLFRVLRYARDQVNSTNISRLKLQNCRGESSARALPDSDVRSAEPYLP